MPIPSSWPELWQFSSYYIGVNVPYRYREVNAGLIKTDPPDDKQGYEPNGEQRDLPEVRTPQRD